MGRKKRVEGAVYKDRSHVHLTEKERNSGATKPRYQGDVPLQHLDRKNGLSSETGQVFAELLFFAKVMNKKPDSNQPSNSSLKSLQENTFC